MTDKMTEKTQNAEAQKVQKSDEEWKKELTPEQYQVARQCGTERPFTGEYWNKHDDGRTTVCAVERCCSARKRNLIQELAGRAFMTPPIRKTSSSTPTRATV